MVIFDFCTIDTGRRTTRLHSSRMHTTCSLTISPTMHCYQGCLLLGGVCSWEAAWSKGVPGPEGYLLPGGGGVVSQHALRHIPPVNRMRDRCKNITLPQTSFAGGNDSRFAFLFPHEAVNVTIHTISPFVTYLGSAHFGEISVFFSEQVFTLTL